MNTREEQIAEMAKVIIKAGERYYKMPVDIECADSEASELYEAGYRKQSDTVREILQMIKDKGLFRYGGYLLHDSDFDTIGKLYGVEVEE